MTKKFIVSFIIALFSFSQVSFAFSDVDASNEYAQAIDALAEQNIASGYSDNTFRPTQDVTRAEFLKMVLMSSGATELASFNSETSLKNCFPDVTDQWFAKYVCYAKKKGWVMDNNDGLFHPERSVNLAEASKIIMLQDSPDRKDTLWYRPYIDFMSSDNYIPPSVETINKNLNRGEVAEILSRRHHLTNDLGCKAITFSWNGDTPVKKLTFGGEYFLYDGKVSYRGLDGKEQELTDVDYDSFEDIDDCWFFKDKNHIYFNGKILSLADVKNFKSDSPYFWGNDGEVYYANPYSNEVTLVETADPQTFHRYQHSSFFTDKNYVYNDGEKIEGSNGPTFQIVDENVHSREAIYAYGKDNNLLYLLFSYEGLEVSPLSNVDLKSFEIVADKVWKDKNNVYFWNKKIDNVQPAQFKFLGRLEYRQDAFFMDFFTDGKNVYYYGEVSNSDRSFYNLSILDEADVKTFKIMSTVLAKDKYHQYTFENGNFEVK